MWGDLILILTPFDFLINYFIIFGLLYKAIFSNTKSCSYHFLNNVL